MWKAIALVLATSFAAGEAFALPGGLDSHSTAIVSERGIIPVQYGQGPGRGDGRGPVRCRVVRVPGSGMGPQRVCSREYQRCRTVVVPGSGQGPQRVCD